MRLFVAIEIPQNISEALVKVQQLLPERAKKTDSFHITLKFLGEVENWHEIDKALGRVEFESFMVGIEEIGAFPNKRLPRIIWAGIKESREINELKKRIDRELPEYRDDKKFHPHVTLARIKSRERIDFESINKKFVMEKENSFEVSRFILFKSVLTAKGPVYTALKEYLAKDF